MATLFGMTDGDSLVPNYIDQDVESITAEERKNRSELDELIDKVHNNHSTITWMPATDPSVDIAKERQRLLEQHRRLPGAPKLNLRSRAGEIMVTFYNYVLHKPPESDEDDGEEDVLDTDSSFEGRQDDKESTCRPVPLQYLYKIRGDELEMIPRRDLLRFLPKSPGDAAHKRSKISGGDLRIIEFPTPTCAGDFLKSMRDISLEELVNDPKSGISKIKYDKYSAFLTGVALCPSIPRVAHRSSPFLFVAIPYLGQEPKSSASFRKEPPVPVPVPNPNNIPRLERVAEKLTAYPIVDGDNGRHFSNSSLSLFQYKFPLRSDTKVFDKWQTALDGEEWHTTEDSKTEGDLIVVHQALFMVFDDETIAAFRAPNDIRPEYSALFPSYCESVGAYHALINIIHNILRSSEALIPQKFRQMVSELEFLVQARHDGWDRIPSAQGGLVLADKDLTLKLRTVETELSAIINIVDTQIDALRDLRKFQLRKGTEQRKIMGKKIDMVVEGRESFRENIRSILKDLQAAQQLLRYLLAETARTQVEDIGSKLMIATEAATKSAEAASRGIEAVTKVAKQARDASEKNAKQWKRQGAKITVLTVILTVFAPLNFMTSYRGMNLHDIKNTTWKQARFWMLSLLLTTSILLFVIAVGFRREWAKKAKLVKWIFSRLSTSHRRSGRVTLAGTPHSISGSDTSSSISEHKIDLSDPWSHDPEAQEGREGIWKKFWDKPSDGEDYWDYK